jgi:peptide/nickel transport system substrate-binding protein
VVAVGLLLVACGGGGQGTATPASGPKHGDKLTVAFNIEPDTLDPQAQTTTAVQALVNMTSEELVTYDKDGKLSPRLATSWQQSTDGLSYTFTLRQNVKFSDGTPFNAEAVKFSLDRLASPTTFKAQPGVLAGIKDVQVVDQLHVKIDLKTAFAPFLDALTQAGGAITSPKAIEQYGNSATTIVHPVGTGPYVLSEYVKGDHLTFTENKDYWGKKPGYTTQIFKIVPEAANRESLVKAGQADVAFNPPPNDLAALRNDGDLKVLLLPSDRSIFIWFNTQDSQAPLLQKKEVRQALNYAVNRDAIIKNLTYDTTSKADAPLAPGVFGYCKAGDYPYNPDKAKQMLQQAGATNLSITMRSPQGRYIADYAAAQAVAGDLRKVGLTVNLANPPDWKSYLAQVQVPADKASTDIHLIGWAPGFLDASQAMLPFQKSQMPPAGSNNGYYSNPQVESLLAKAGTESDKAQREKDYCAANKLIWNDAPWIFLWIQQNPTVTTTKVTGVYGLKNEQVVTTWAQPA